MALVQESGTKESKNYSQENEETVFKGKIFCAGEIKFEGMGRQFGQFVRVPHDINPGTIFELLTGEWNLTAPNLVVSLVGGQENFQIKPWLRDILRKGLVKAAQITGAWILTNGLRMGITRHVGESVRDHSLASTSKVRVIAIGIAPLGKIQSKEELLNAKHSQPVCYKTDESSQGPCYSLDRNHSHFILVDEQNDPGRATELILRLEKHISEQRTGYGGSGSIEIPVLCMLVNGCPKTLERVYQGMNNSTPWLILAGSGGTADVLASLMNEPLVPEAVLQHFREKFPKESFSWEEILKWTELIQNIMEKQHLLTIHDLEQEGSEELDTVILKGLVKACKSQSQEASEYLDELKLAVAWNRVDIAKSDIFNGDVEWRSSDLEEVMMDALVNDKPEFVKLFIDNGMNMYEFLTYGRLQDLYCSISQKCLLHELLLKKHEESKLTITTNSYSGLEKKPRFSLYDVSRVLKDFLHDACKGFYQDCKQTGNKKTEKSKYRLSGQKLLPDMNQQCENLWRDLFLWAVLQNRQEMANYFWAMGQEAVPAALAACKILKEMAHLEKEAETARSMKDNKYEQFALELFSECYTNSEERAFALLVRKTKYWSKATCLQLATEADAKTFFAHDGVQALLTKIWWGDMSTDTQIWKLIMGFICPPLIYSNIIKFSEEEQQPSEDPQMLKELEAQETEKNALFTDKVAREKPEKPNHNENHLCKTFLLPRWKKFWSAPVSVFFGNVILYFAFLILFAYVLLADFQKPPPEGPSVSEIILYFWVFTLVLEEIRQSFFTDEDINIVKKFQQYVEDNWNKCDMVAIILFIVAVTCRMMESTYEAGRTVLALDFMVFALRLIHIFAIHKQLGPKIIIVERMMKDVFFFLFFLSVWLIAYGVANQALLHPNETRVDWIFRRVLYRPYLQIFGQIPLEEIDVARMNDVNCTTDPVKIMMGNLEPCPNRYANWLVILLLVIFLLVTNVLLLNLLIAMFSYTFQVVQGKTDIFWKFQRYNLIVEYHNRPALAPPFIILSHISMIIRSIFNKAGDKKEHFEREMPESLDQKLITWEAVQKENYLANLDKEKRESSQERLKKTSTKVEALLNMVSGFKEQEKRLVAVEHKMKYCTDVLNWMTDSFAQNNIICNRPPPRYSSPAASYCKTSKASLTHDRSMDNSQRDLFHAEMTFIDE
ncbi:transient receptor potential cation channel subfamily M member 5 [Protopterus annectens]|uniref:transient receptor potential cation channel subfamily M member 5 n=1 Tax=Protopterus annectens TaxID=7888 RepID=UPI001CF9F22D|nr:transient receptor potential cation channel subfamily M member 5 [Protopterus annectens]